MLQRLAILSVLCCAAMIAAEQTDTPIADNTEKRDIPMPTDTPESTVTIQVGDTLLDAPLRTTAGEDISLSDLLKQQPSIIIVFRGAWCPICSRNLKALAENISLLREQGFQVLAISPDAADAHRTLTEKKKLPYQVYSDYTHSFIRQCGLAYWMDKKTETTYRTKYHFPLITAPNDERVSLPVPAVFITNTNAEIRFAYANPNYKIRLQTEDIIQAINDIVLTPAKTNKTMK